MTFWAKPLTYESQPGTAIDFDWMVLFYASCDQTILFSLEHSQFLVDLVDRFLWVKAQNSVETVSLSDSIFGDNLQSSAEQKQQQ